MNAQAVTAQLVAAQRHQNDAARIADLEQYVQALQRRVAALETRIERIGNATVDGAILALLSDGQSWHRQTIAQVLNGYSPAYLNTLLGNMTRAGLLERPRKGWYRKVRP